MDAGKLGSLEAAALRARLLAIETAASHTDADTADSPAHALFERALAGTRHHEPRQAPREPQPAAAAPANPAPAPTVQLSNAAVAASKNPEFAAIINLVMDRPAGPASRRPVEQAPTENTGAARSDASPQPAVRTDVPHAAILSATAAAAPRLADSPPVEPAERAPQWPPGEIVSRMLAPVNSDPVPNYVNWVMIVSAIAGVLILVLL